MSHKHHHSQSTTEEIRELEKEILCKIKKSEDIEKELLCLLEKIKKLIKEDIAIDNSILNIIQAILNLVITINTNVGAILVLVQQINANINILISLACRPISSVPFVITEPGCYKVINELFFTGPGNAITINTTDVIIDGGNFTLTLIGPTTVGVFTNGRENIIIRNFNIKSDDPNPAVNTLNRGMVLNNVNHVFLERIHTSFTNRGISFNVASNITILESLFDRHTNDGTRASVGLALLGNITNVLVRDSKFFQTNSIEDAGRGIALQPIAGVINTNNVQVIDCQFSDSLIFAASFSPVLEINNFEVRGCQFSITDPNYQGWSLLVVSEVGGMVIKGVTIRDCTFVNPNASNFYEPILLVGVSGFIIEGCNITANSVGNFIDRGIINVALIHLGYTITSILDTEDIPDAQVENGTIKNCTLNGGTSLQTAHQNVGIYIEAFCNNITIDEVNIYQTGVGNVAPLMESLSAKKKILKMITLNGEEEFNREKSGPNKNIDKINKFISKVKMPVVNKLKIPPPIPDQRAAAILIDGGFNIYIKNCVISDAGAGTPGTLPGHGIVLSGSLEFQTVPALQPPILTITTPPTAGVKIWKTIVSSNQGNGIEDNGVLNDIKENNVKNNELTGILLTGISAFVEGNNVFANFSNGIQNTGVVNAILNNNAARNLPLDYVGVPAVVVQGFPCVAGQNVQGL